MSTNPWVMHCKEYAKEHNVRYGEALKLAKASYVKGTKGAGIFQEIAKPVEFLKDFAESQSKRAVSRNKKRGTYMDKNQKRDRTTGELLGDIATNLIEAPSDLAKASKKTKFLGGSSKKVKANAIGAIPSIVEVGKDVLENLGKTFDPKEIAKTRKRQAKMSIVERLGENFTNGPIVAANKSLRKNKPISKILSGVDGGISKSLGYGKSDGEAELKRHRRKKNPIDAEVVRAFAPTAENLAAAERAARLVAARVKGAHNIPAVEKFNLRKTIGKFEGMGNSVSNTGFTGKRRIGRGGFVAGTTVVGSQGETVTSKRLIGM